MKPWCHQSSKPQQEAITMKILLAVDGSEIAIRATRKLVETSAWYKQAPQVLLVTVQPPVPYVFFAGSPARTWSRSIIASKERRRSRRASRCSTQQASGTARTCSWRDRPDDRRPCAENRLRHDLHGHPRHVGDLDCGGRVDRDPGLAPYACSCSARAITRAHSSVQIAT